MRTNRIASPEPERQENAEAEAEPDLRPLDLGPELVVRVGVTGMVTSGVVPTESAPSAESERRATSRWLCSRASAACSMAVLAESEYLGVDAWPSWCGRNRALDHVGRELGLDSLADDRRR